jgi:hypothetical protein
MVEELFEAVAFEGGCQIRRIEQCSSWLASSSPSPIIVWPCAAPDRGLNLQLQVTTAKLKSDVFELDPLLFLGHEQRRERSQLGHCFQRNLAVREAVQSRHSEGNNARTKTGNFVLEDEVIIRIDALHIVEGAGFEAVEAGIALRFVKDVVQGVGLPYPHPARAKRGLSC